MEKPLKSRALTTYIPPSASVRSLRKSLRGKASAHIAHVLSVGGSPAVENSLARLGAAARSPHLSAFPQSVFNSTGICGKVRSSKKSPPSAKRVEIRPDRAAEAEKSTFCPFELNRKSTGSEDEKNEQYQGLRQLIHIFDSPYYKYNYYLFIIYSIYFSIYIARYREEKRARQIKKHITQPEAKEKYFY